MSPQPNIFDQVNPSSTTTPPPVTLPVAGAPASGNIFDQVNPAGATGAITAPPASTPPVGPNGQPNPRNVYAATDEESTPEGAAAAIARREGQHPILSGIGQGTESLLQPVFHPIDTVENIVKQSLPPFQVYDSLKKAYPLIQTYENARSQGKSVWESISSANDHARKQDAAAQAVDQAIANYKKNPTQTTAKILTQVAGTVAMLAAGGSGATAEADVPLVTRAAETEAPVAEAAVPKPGIVGKVKNYATDVWNGKKVAQPETQAAVRSGVKSSVEVTNANASAEANAAREAAVPAPVGADKYPVSIIHDEDGNVLNADGRHRVVEAWERGDKTIPVTTKLADGSTEVIEQSPQAVAKKMGLGDSIEEAKAALDNTDANQPYRAGNGEPRKPVYETPIPKASSDATPVKPIKRVNEPNATTPITTTAKNETIVDDHLNALEQQKATAYKKMDDAAGFDVKALKDKLKTDQYNLKQLGSSDPDKAGRLVEAINDSTDRIAEAEAKMKDAGIDPARADALNTRWEAGQDWRDSLRKGTNPDGTIDPKKLWTDAKALRNSKYGDRLEQWFGSKQAADAYVKVLEQAQANGIRAMNRQAFVKQILWTTLPTAALATAGYETLKH